MTGLCRKGYHIIIDVGHKTIQTISPGIPDISNKKYITIEDYEGVQRVIFMEHIRDIVIKPVYDMSRPTGRFV